MIHYSLPKRPYEAIEIHPFSINGVNYLIVVEYYSRFFELKKLKRNNTENRTQALCQIFMRFGAPAIVRSDIVPQFASAQFKAFVERWGSSHITSRTYFPQSDGTAKGTVQTTKQLIMKSRNIHKALHAHRDAPGKKRFYTSRTEHEEATTNQRARGTTQAEATAEHCRIDRTKKA
ncbi:hypothetical protein MRX96_021936 [Rhipicephalus microplus]